MLTSPFNNITQSMFTFTDCIQRVLKRVLKSDEDSVLGVDAALLINHATNARAAELICVVSGDRECVGEEAGGTRG